jgi:two-component system CheB/CheR fusion protein
MADRALLLSEDLFIERVYGDISDLLRIAGDTRLRFDLSILMPKVAQDARTIAAIAARQKEKRKGRIIRLDHNPDMGIQLEAMPLRATRLDEAFVLIAIHEVALKSEQQAPIPGNGDAPEAQHIRSLESELDVARRALEQTIEELETSNEEYQSTNEELQSSNEELQATNEELETSKEELQSTNEELVTVNEELQISKYELEAVSEEQRAILASIAVPLVIVDTALQITTLNDAAARFFDVKRPVKRMHISQLKLPREFPDLVEICDTNLRLGKRESVNFNLLERAYSLEVVTFYSQDGAVRGVTLAIWEERRASKLLDEMANIFKASNTYLMHRTIDGAIKVALNAPFQKGGADHTIFASGSESVFDMLQSDRAKRALELDKKFLNGNQVFDSTVQQIQADDNNGPAFEHTQRFRIAGDDDEDDSVFVLGRFFSDLETKEE